MQMDSIYSQWGGGQACIQSMGEEDRLVYSQWGGGQACIQSMGEEDRLVNKLWRGRIVSS